jgi:hypothetical protein
VSELPRIRAAARWGSRFALERNLRLADAQLALAALAGLPGDSSRAGAEALINLVRSCHRQEPRSVRLSCGQSVVVRSRRVRLDAGLLLVDGGVLDPAGEPIDQAGRALEDHEIGAFRPRC